MLSKRPLPSPESGDAARVTRLLSQICAAPELHARFLNTLSLMEHIGSRKIMASQSGEDLKQDTLKHLAEETRHAFFFKRAAESAAREALDYSAANTIATAAARAYMGRLDAFLAASLAGGTPRECAYLYMSLIVEIRAVWFYRLYQQVLAERGASLSLKSVLAEEERHLSDMTARLVDLDPDADMRIREFVSYEGERFTKLWSALERACSPRHQ
jgi:hypothetical protein